MADALTYLLKAVLELGPIDQQSDTLTTLTLGAIYSLSMQHLDKESCHRSSKSRPVLCIKHALK